MCIFKIGRDPDKSEWSSVLGAPLEHIMDNENIAMSAIFIYSGHSLVTSPNLHLALAEMHVFLLHAYIHMYNIISRVIANKSHMASF